LFVVRIIIVSANMPPFVPRGAFGRFHPIYFQRREFPPPPGLHSSLIVAPLPHWFPVTTVSTHSLFFRIVLRLHLRARCPRPGSPLRYRPLSRTLTFFLNRCHYNVDFVFGLFRDNPVARFCTSLTEMSTLSGTFSPVFLSS